MYCQQQPFSFSCFHIDYICHIQINSTVSTTISFSLFGFTMPLLSHSMFDRGEMKFRLQLLSALFCFRATTWKVFYWKSRIFLLRIFSCTTLTFSPLQLIIKIFQLHHDIGIVGDYYFDFRNRMLLKNYLISSFWYKPWILFNSVNVSSSFKSSRSGKNCFSQSLHLSSKFFWCLI